ncbi:hypothetical protein DBR39_16640 [Chryseobacterium sp. KBW03]|uniref:SEFIR domain-containing protein n=1 Tax=Chryseobacterium sp. KBW03 TaxID=2153362 RepID=UPI000F5954C6|nr:SEFIR domain-containing protein [Chryseobacterium sp. KBW03]RQO36707.1 hypothetical protein DBR39_16640 [Chryseobacterium sp. KBW03]
MEESQKENEKQKINVFVTYSWDNEEHQEKVHAFTNLLRDNGFHAEVDKMLIQSETAKDFKVMMHKGITDYNKVIVVLSEGYKTKAENFIGGVGTEYSLILKDLEENPNKYILVSFDGRENSIIPLFFKAREIINLKENNESEKQKLFSKLLDINLYKFNEVASKLPEINTKEVPSMFFKEQKKSQGIEILELNISQDGSSYFAKLLKNVEFNLSIGFRNLNEEALNDYSIEIYYPKQALSFEVDGRIEGDYKVCLIESANRIFSQQTKVVNLEQITLRNYTIKELIDKNIIVKIYTENGVFEREFPLKNFLIKNHFTDINEKLSLDLFLDENY